MMKYTINDDLFAEPPDDDREWPQMLRDAGIEPIADVAIEGFYDRSRTVLEGTYNLLETNCSTCLINLRAGRLARMEVIAEVGLVKSGRGEELLTTGKTYLKCAHGFIVGVSHG